MSTTIPLDNQVPVHPGRLPLAALLIMALMGFLLIATETMPAGLLPHIAQGLGTTEGTAGQFVSAYALGTVIASIPAVTLTRGMRRKPVFIAAIVGFLVANTVTAISTDILLSLTARFVAGAFSGLAWGMTAGYARRITAPRFAGRALAIASIGTPLGLAVGTPFGSWLGTTFDWRWPFIALSGLTVLTLVSTIFLIPDASGQSKSSALPLRRVFLIPGVALILAVITTWMLAHNIMYTYIGSFFRSSGIQLSVDLALVTFGVAAIVGVVVTGAIIDRALRPLVLGSIALFVAAGVMFVLIEHSVALTMVALVLWGCAFGGAATQLQTAVSDAAGDNADVANSMLGVAFNLAIFAAGVLGAVVITVSDGFALPIVMIFTAAIAFAIALTSRRTAFPAMRPLR